MGLLTYLATATVRDGASERDGKTLSRPALLVSDGTNQTWAVDVDIGVKSFDPNTGDEIIVPLRNVPIANGVRELIYADIGAAVRVRRSASGLWEITGYSKRAPGTYNRVPVAITKPSIGIPPYTVGTPVSVGLSARMLTYGELETMGGYGNVAYGTMALYRGATLIELRT